MKKGGARSRRPLVSVLMPVYNGSRFLEQSLRSARTQTYRDLEIIIRDDGSVDSSPEIVAAAAERDQRIRVVPAGATPLGGTENMVELLRLATGEYVKFLHQDDLLEPSCIERLVRPMRFDSGLTMASSARHRIDAHGAPTQATFAAYQPLRHRDMRLPGSLVVSEMVRGLENRLGEPSVALFRNGVLSPEEAFVLNGRVYSYINDMALWTNLLRAGDLYWHATPLSSFRVHDSQRSAQLHESITVAAELADYLLFGVSIGAVGHADVIERTRALSGYIQGLHQRISELPTNEQAPYVPALAEALAGVRRMLDYGPGRAAAASMR